MPEAISACKLTRRFGLNPAVDAIDLSIRQGETFGFLGPNGAGKTTTIKLLLGLLLPSCGQSEVLGLDSWTKGNLVRRISAVLFDDPGLYGWLNGPENVALFCRLYGANSSELQNRIKTLMPDLLLSETDAKLPARKLSRGTRQKWGLCRVFALRPKVLFLDEPTTGLDPTAAIHIRQYLKNYARETGATVFFSTHNLEEATKMCDRVGVICKGRIVALGRPDELCKGPRRYVIRYGGDSLDSTILLQKAVSHQDNRLEVQIAGEKEIGEIVRSIILSGREVFEVRPLENELESLFASLEAR